MFYPAVGHSKHQYNTNTTYGNVLRHDAGAFILVWWFRFDGVAALLQNSKFLAYAYSLYRTHIHHPSLIARNRLARFALYISSPRLLSQQPTKSSTPKNNHTRKGFLIQNESNSGRKMAKKVMRPKPLILSQ
jgi:hypothetical protein